MTGRPRNKVRMTHHDCSGDLWSPRSWMTHHDCSGGLWSPRSWMNSPWLQWWFVIPVRVVEHKVSVTHHNCTRDLWSPWSWLTHHDCSGYLWSPWSQWSTRLVWLTTTALVIYDPMIMNDSPWLQWWLVIPVITVEHKVSVTHHDGTGDLWSQDHDWLTMTAVVTCDLRAHGGAWRWTHSDPQPPPHEICPLESCAKKNAVYLTHNSRQHAFFMDVFLQIHFSTNKGKSCIMGETKNQFKTAD